MATKSDFQLHLITDGIKQANELCNTVEKALQGGTDVIQLRYKSAAALDVYKLGKALLPIIHTYQAGLLINDRVDVALALQTTGVHLAGKSLPVAATKTIIGERMLLGCSVHSVEEARQAQAAGASYVTFGHIFPTKSKPGLPPQGTDALFQVVQSVSIPVLAIGGITAENIDLVLATGCAGIAVIGAISDDKDPQTAAGKLKARMNASPYRPKHAFIKK